MVYSQLIAGYKPAYNHFGIKCGFKPAYSLSVFYLYADTFNGCLHRYAFQSSNISTNLSH